MEDVVTLEVDVVIMVVEVVLEIVAVEVAVVIVGGTGTGAMVAEKKEVAIETGIFFF
jgi:hypothetical protein